LSERGLQSGSELSEAGPVWNHWEQPQPRAKRGRERAASISGTIGRRWYMWTIEIREQSMIRWMIKIDDVEILTTLLAAQL
jgi:hypothetical protein